MYTGKPMTNRTPNMFRREYNVQMTDTFNNWSSRKSHVLRAKSESQGAESDSKSESPTDESESSEPRVRVKSESLKNWTRVRLESESWTRVLHH